MAEPTLPDARPDARSDSAPDSRAGSRPVDAARDAQPETYVNSEAAGDMSELGGTGGAGAASRRLTRADTGVLLLWLLVAVVGASVAYRYFFRAFPEAAVNFKVTRSAALAEARTFVMREGATVPSIKTHGAINNGAGQGSGLADYQSTIVFNVDDEEKTYLEREVGLEEANRLMSSSQVSVWYWEARFFKPLQKEEFHVRVDPGGRITGYGREIDEAAPGARLDRAGAQARAEDFLRNTLHTPLEQYSFLPEEANSVARPNRTDWDFTWERTGFRAKDAPYRLHVTLQGDEIGGYGEALKVPEAWQRSFARLRSSNEFIETLALIPYAILLGAALSVVLALGRRGLANWSSGLKLGLFVTALYFVMQMDQWPLTRAGYDTNGAYSSFLLAQIVGAVAMSAMLALLVVIAYVPGEPLYRVDQPARLRIGSAFTLPGLRSKEFFMSAVIGVCLAAAHIGYVVLFYVVGRRFGVWAPQDLQYSDTMSTALPWVFPLTIGIYAASSEEFLFRLFSVHYLLRSTKSKVLAVVLPAFAWGFLHSNYPQEPAYIRGIEVGLIGIVAGLVMLRWGILATLTWHYTVDAFLTGLSLMRASDLYSRISGTVVGLGALIPIGIAGVLYLTRGGFAEQEALLNRAEPLVEHAAPHAEPSVAVPASYTALRPRVLGMLALGAALGVALLAGVRPQAIGSFVRFPLDAQQAERVADGVLSGRGVDVESYRRATTIQYTFDSLANEYLRRSVGIAGANRIYRDIVPSAFWTTRFFRDSQKEEYLVVLSPGGALHALHHTLAETTPGANLSKEDAQARAETFLRDAKNFDFAQWKLVESQSDKLPARTDHTFVWEQTTPLCALPGPGAAEGARVRATLKVQGVEPSGYRIFVHVPEEWRRQQTRTTLGETLRTIGVGIFAAAFIIAVLVQFFRSLKTGEVAAVPWTRLARWSLAVLVAALAGYATLEPQYLSAYRTDLPFRTFLGTTIIGLSLGAMLFYSLSVFLFGLAWIFLARRYGAHRLPGAGGMPAAYYRDGLVAGVCGSAILLGLRRLPELAARLWPVARFSFPASVPDMLDARWPAVHAVSGAVMHGLLAVGVLMLTWGFASCYLRGAGVQAALLVALVVLAGSRAGSWGDFVQSAVIGVVEVAVIWWGAQRILGVNLLAYVVVALVVSLSGAAAELLEQPNALLRANGWAVVAAAVMLVAWAAFKWRALGRNLVHPGAEPLI